MMNQDYKYMEEVNKERKTVQGLRVISPGRRTDRQRGVRQAVTGFVIYLYCYLILLKLMCIIWVKKKNLKQTSSPACEKTDRRKTSCG